MGRRFAWFAVGKVAFATAATGAAVVYAAGPLATLRDAVTPVHQPVPPSLPIVTGVPGDTVPGEAATGDTATAGPLPPAGGETQFAPPTPPDLVLPELVLPDMQALGSVLPEAVLPETVLPENVLPETVLLENVLPEAVLPETVLPEAATPVTVAPDSVPPGNGPVPAAPLAPLLLDAALPETPLFDVGPLESGPLGSGALEPVSLDAVLPDTEPTETAVLATAPPESAPPVPTIDQVAADHPMSVGAAEAKVEPPATVAPGEAPATIERLPAAVVGEGVEFSEDPSFRKPLNAIRVDLAPPAGELPPNAAASLYAGGAETIVPRAGQKTIFFWQATNLCHRPLYFAEDYVERDGRSFGAVQPVVSGVQFFGSIPLLPYRMVRQPPCRCVYTLGESRPDGYGRRPYAR